MSPTPVDPARRLDEALARLPRGIEPGRDLWPAIEPRLQDRPVRAPRRWAWAAAAAVLLVAGSSLVTATLVRRHDAATARTVSPPAGALVTTAAFGPGHRVGPAYLANRRELVRSLEARIAGLPPQARSRLAANLAELRRASAEINAALELHPGDPLLEEMLINVYQDEITVLANVDQLTAAGAGGTTNDPTRMQL
jgi:hypothetical protein